jgi:Epoxide hydrolase N terminus
MSETPDLNRRRIFAAEATTVAAGHLGHLGFSRRVMALTDLMTKVETGSEKTAIRPFRVKVSDAELSGLRRRIKATKWPERETVTDDSQGVQLATTQKLARYWATEYDWRPCEARLNALPQFVTEIDGLDIHFIHVRSKHENALPVKTSSITTGSIEAATSPRRNSRNCLWKSCARASDDCANKWAAQGPDLASTPSFAGTLAPPSTSPFAQTERTCRRK